MHRIFDPKDMDKRILFFDDSILTLCARGYTQGFCEHIAREELAQNMEKISYPHGFYKHINIV